MATTKDAAHPKQAMQYPAGSIPHKDYHLSAQDKWTPFLPANLAAQALEMNMFPMIGLGATYLAAPWTVTTSGAGTVADAVTPGGGILCTTANTAGYYSGVQAKQLFTPAADKVICDYARVRVSHANMGFWFGVGNVQADPTGTDYTDFVGFYKAPGAATMVSKVIGNTGTTANSGTLATFVADTEVVIGYNIKLHATNPTGFFLVDGTQYGMTNDQVTQAIRILTTPPSCSAIRLGVGVSGQTYTATFVSAVGGVNK